MQNSSVTFYKESLSLGQLLFPERKLSLYKYFLKTKRDSYLQDAAELNQKGVLSRSIANGEILYEVKENQVLASAREMGDSESAAISPSKYSIFPISSWIKVN